MPSRVHLGCTFHTVLQILTRLWRSFVLWMVPCPRQIIWVTIPDSGPEVASVPFGFPLPASHSISELGEGQLRPQYSWTALSRDEFCPMGRGWMEEGTYWLLSCTPQERSLFNFVLEGIWNAEDLPLMEKYSKPRLEYGGISRTIFTFPDISSLSKASIKLRCWDGKEQNEVGGGLNVSLTTPGFSRFSWKNTFSISICL